MSSGYKINRSADNAAGLQISEKMRSQIRGLNQASRNIQDGISLCQVADGALSETHEILQRMRELSVQAANDTNQQIDRAAIQAEIEALTEEVDRIAKDTSFNDGIYPLKANMSGTNNISNKCYIITKIDGTKWALPSELYNSTEQIGLKQPNANSKVNIDGTIIQGMETTTVNAIRYKGIDDCILVEWYRENGMHFFRLFHW